MIIYMIFYNMIAFLLIREWFRKRTSKCSESLHLLSRYRLEHQLLKYHFLWVCFMFCSFLPIRPLPSWLSLTLIRRRLPDSSLWSTSHSLQKSNQQNCWTRYWNVCMHTHSTCTRTRACWGDDVIHWYTRSLLYCMYTWVHTISQI